MSYKSNMGIAAITGLTLTSTVSGAGVYDFRVPVPGTKYTVGYEQGQMKLNSLVQRAQTSQVSVSQTGDTTTTTMKTSGTVKPVSQSYQSTLEQLLPRIDVDGDMFISMPEMKAYAIRMLREAKDKAISASQTPATTSVTQTPTSTN